LFTPPDPFKSPFYSADREMLEIEISPGLDDREVEAVIRSMLGACISAEEIRRVFASRGLAVSEKRIYRALRNLERAGEVVYRKRRWCPP